MQSNLDVALPAQATRVSFRGSRESSSVGYASTTFGVNLEY